MSERSDRTERKTTAGNVLDLICINGPLLPLLPLLHATHYNFWGARLLLLIIEEITWAGGFFFAPWFNSLWIMSLCERDLLWKGFGFFFRSLEIFERAGNWICGDGASLGRRWSVVGARLTLSRRVSVQIIYSGKFATKICLNNTC